jgi:hypothetical protein
LLLHFDDSQLNAVPEDPLLQPDDTPLETQQYMVKDSLCLYCGWVEDIKVKK